MDLGDASEERRQFIGRAWWVYGLVAVGIGLVSAGVLLAIRSSPPLVEIVRSDTLGGDPGTGAQITVDVAGAVAHPGVYQLEPSSRVGEAIARAGGLLPEANQEWVAQSLNLAQVVKDGEKIYIPTISESSEVDKANAKINLNKATQVELESLPGIGESRAKAIINNRPYSDLGELASKAGIPTSVLEDIKDLVSIY